MGNILHVFVHAANNADTSSGILTAHATCLYYSTLKKFCADAGYRETFIEDVKLILDREVDISEKNQAARMGKIKMAMGSRKDIGLAEPIKEIK